MNGGGNRRDIGAGREIAPLDDDCQVGAGRGLTGIDLLNRRRSIRRDIGVCLRRGRRGEGCRKADEQRA